MLTSAFFFFVYFFNLQKLFYPLENQGEVGAASSLQKTSICGTIWSMCFISYSPSKNCDAVLAILLNR